MSVEYICSTCGRKPAFPYDGQHLCKIHIAELSGVAVKPKLRVVKSTRPTGRHKLK